MLVELTIQNFRSFSDKQSFNLLASRETTHRERVPRFESRYRMSVSPVAAIYGPNGSGKTTLASCLRYLREVVTEPRLPGNSLPYAPFRLDSKWRGQPSTFSVSYMWQETLYVYEISVDRTAIVSETLTEILSRSEHVLFDRADSQNSTNSTIRTLAQGLQDNATLAEALGTWAGPKDQDFAKLQSPYQWFRSVLALPASAITEDFVGNFGYYDLLNSRVGDIDTGITGLVAKQVPSSDLGLSDDELENLLSPITESVSRTVIRAGKLYEISMDGGEPRFTKISMAHRSREDTTPPLEWAEESSGTRQAMSLIPLLLVLTLGHAVLVIDEIDESLHSELSRILIQSFLNSVSQDSRSQLIFTTHDLLLMDQTMLRKDEIWLVEKDRYGSSEIIPLSEFEGIRKDKDILKSYLEGRFGALPAVRPLSLGASPHG